MARRRVEVMKRKVSDVEAGVEKAAEREMLM